MKPLRIVLTADFHFSTNPNISDQIIPLMRYGKEVLDIFFKQMQDMHIDLFILCGDHTVSGKKQDREAFQNELFKIKEAGIPILMTTGNHDFDLCSVEEYQDTYFPLLDCTDKDPSSLSYAYVKDNIRFLVMDDSSQKKIGFSEETMQWLKKQIALPENIIFLSHHNLFLNAWHKNPLQYQIENKDLIPLLKEYGVKLSFTAHQHVPYIQTQDSLTEIVLPAPLAAPFQYGYLEIGDEIHYEVRNLDIKKYNPLLYWVSVQKVNNCHELRKNGFLKFFEKRYDLETAERMTDSLQSWFDAYEKEDLSSFEADPLFLQTIHELHDSGYEEYILFLLKHHDSSITITY